MNKILAIALLSLSMIAFSTSAYANGGEGNNTQCNGQGNPNSPCEGGDDGGGGGGAGGGGSHGGGVNTNTSTNTNDQSQSQSQDQSQSQEATGGSVGDINITVESPESSGGVDGQSAGPQVTSDVQVEGDGAITVDASDNTVYEAPSIPVASAATSFASVCTSGGAGQGRKLGVSLAVTSDVCVYLMMADAWVAMGDMDKALEAVEAAGRHAKVGGFMGYIRHVITLGVL